METMLLIIVGSVAALVFFRPAPRTQIVYVPIEVVEVPREGLGCLPLIVGPAGAGGDPIVRSWRNCIQPGSLAGP